MPSDLPSRSESPLQHPQADMAKNFPRVPCLSAREDPELSPWFRCTIGKSGKIVSAPDVPQPLPLVGDTFPLLGEPLRRDFDDRAQFLREQGNTKFFEEPTELLQFKIEDSTL